MTPIKFTAFSSKFPFYVAAESIAAWTLYDKNCSRILINGGHEIYIEELPEEILAAIQSAKGGQP